MNLKVWNSQCAPPTQVGFLFSVVISQRIVTSQTNWALASLFTSNSSSIWRWCLLSVPSWVFQPLCYTGVATRGKTVFHLRTQSLSFQHSHLVTLASHLFNAYPRQSSGRGINTRLNRTFYALLGLQDSFLWSCLRVQTNTLAIRTRRTSFLQILIRKGPNFAT